MINIRKFLEYLYGNIVVLILGFVATPIITRVVTPEHYGKYQLTIAIANSLVFILLLGTDQYIIRFFNEEKINTVRKSISISIQAFLISSIIIFVILRNFVTSFADSEVVFIGLITAFIIALNRISLVVTRMEFKGKVYSLGNVINKATFILISIPLLLLTSFGDYRVLVLSFILGFTVQCVFYVHSNYQLFKEIATSRVKTINTLDVLSYSAPLSISAFLTNLLLTIDKTILSRTLGYEELGIYSSAFVFYTMLSIFVVSFNSYFIPILMKKYSEGKDVSDIAMLSNIFVVIACIIITIIVLTKRVLILFLGPNYRTVVDLLPFILTVPFVNLITEIISVRLLINRKTMHHLYPSIIAVAINITMNLILIPIYGIKAAGFTFVVSNSVILLLRNKLAITQKADRANYFKLIATIMSIITFTTISSLGFSLSIEIFVSIVFIIFVLFIYRGSIKSFYIRGGNYD